MNNCSVSENKYPLFVTFSMYTNGMKLFSCDNSKNSDVIECIRGIRVLSTLWIVFIHTHALPLMLPIKEITPFLEVIIIIARLHIYFFKKKS